LSRHSLSPVNAKLQPNLTSLPQVERKVYTLSDLASGLSKIEEMVMVIDWNGFTNGYNETSSQHHLQVGFVIASVKEIARVASGLMSLYAATVADTLLL